LNLILAQDCRRLTAYFFELSGNETRTHRGTTMPGHHHDDDDDKGKGKPGTGGAAARGGGSTTDQLVAAARSITLLSSQIEGILSTWIDPPDPDKPVAISATSTIQTQAARITTLANDIMAKLR
jgi:hypothetical protein